jgi:hypothetical protein
VVVQIEMKTSLVDIINRVCTQVRDMMKGQSNHQSYSQVRDKYSIDRWIEYQVDTQVMGPVRREMSSQVWGKLEGQVRDQVIVEVDRHVDRQVYRRIVVTIGGGISYIQKQLK